MGTGRIIIKTNHRRFVLSSIATKNKEQAYNRTPIPQKSRLLPSMENVPSVPLNDSAVPEDISGNACARLFNFMKSKYASATSKIEQAYLCHSTVTGNVVYNSIPGFEDKVEEIIPVEPVECPLSISMESDILLKALLVKYNSQFGEFAPAADIRPVATTSCIEVDPLASIPNKPLRRYNPGEQAEIKLQVESMLKQKIIRPSTSPYGSPILMIKKNTGGWRMCLDYRAVNAITKCNVFPLPRIDDLLDRLQGVSHFSSLDLAQGYYQMGILESDKEKTAFKTVDGLYEFNTITMGLTNASSMFQSMMNTTFKGLEYCVMIYLDDILVFSRSENDHIRDLELVLARLKLHGLVAKGSKCSFFRPSLDFLGHVVSALGILPDPSKVDVVNWAIPVNQTS
jgi:hypothetical protein